MINKTNKWDFKLQCRRNMFAWHGMKWNQVGHDSVSGIEQEENPAINAHIDQKQLRNDNPLFYNSYDMVLPSTN